MNDALLRDRRGTTTIPALFAMGFLCGGIWYLVGVGDAMVFHERMQDAADATAFAPSVLNARGMNVIALVNLVMSAILAVLVAVKIVQLLLVAANVIACAIPFNPYCPLLSSWQSPYSDFVKITDKTVSTVNKGLYRSESAIAKTIPIVGQAKAVLAAKRYQPIVEGGFAASTSLAPSGARFGLPVEDEEFANLCHHASENVQDFLFKPLEFLPGANVIVQPVLKYAGGMIVKLVKAFPGYFCGGGAGGLAAGGLTKATIDDLASSGCRQADKANVSVCTTGLTKSLSSIASGSMVGGAQQTSKRIYRPAEIGGDYYASFGFVVSSHLAKNDVDPHLRAASWETVPDEIVDDRLDRLLGRIQLSKSELYYDPKRTGGATTWTGGTGSMRDEALLNMRWRARLRRFRPPTGEARDLVAGSGVATILRGIPAAAGGAGGGITPAAILGTVLGGDPSELTKWLEKRVPEAKSRATGGVLH